MESESDSPPEDEVKTYILLTLLPKFPLQPLKQVQLIVYRRPTNLRKQVNTIRFGGRRVLQAFIAVCANSTEVVWYILPIPSHYFVCDWLLCNALQQIAAIE